MIATELFKRFPVVLQTDISTYFPIQAHHTVYTKDSSIKFLSPQLISLKYILTTSFLSLHFSGILLTCFRHASSPFMLRLYTQNNKKVKKIYNDIIYMLFDNWNSM